MTSVDLNRVPSFYHGYINQVQETTLQEALEAHPSTFLSFSKEIPDQKWDYAYKAGKWTIKDLVQHLIDAERIFNYRALRFARKDSTPLPGFNEDLYASTAKAGKRTKEDLLYELELVQKSSVALFSSFGEEELDGTGEANGNSIYVKAIGFIIVGHTRHHINIIKERYL